MTSLPSSVIPRTLRFILLVLAWLAAPMWALALAGLWFLDDDGSMFATMGAAVCTFALFIAFFAGRIDQVIVKPAAERAEREQTLVIALDRLSETVTQPQPALRAVR